MSLSVFIFFFFFSSRRRHTRFDCDWSSDVCSSDLIYGGRVMNLLCRISLTPDSCVSQTQTSFERWGAKALIFAKFIPGLAMMAPPLAGAVGMRLARFSAFSTLGGAVWVGAALLRGGLPKSP